MIGIPQYVDGLFIATVLLTLLFIARAAHWNRLVLLVTGAWLLVQGIVSYSNFYTNTTALPPRFLMAVLPPLLLLLLLLATRRGRAWLDGLDLRILTLLHVVRIPVELVLYWLFVYKAVPQLMTFDGRNFDIFSGLTAPIVFYFVFLRQRLGGKVLIVWNLVCLGLLLNIVIHAVLSAPFSFQQLAFNQPNKAVLYFPYLWLPAFIVPVVLLSHVAALRQLLKKEV